MMSSYQGPSTIPGTVDEGEPPGGDAPTFNPGTDTLLFEETWDSYSLNTTNLLNGTGDHTYSERGLSLLGLSNASPLPPGLSAKLTMDYSASGEVDMILSTTGVSSGAANVVCASLQYRTIGTAYHGKMSVFNQGTSRRLLMHVAPRPPYPGATEGVDPNHVECFWSDGDPYTPHISDTPSGYEIWPVWNNDDTAGTPGGIGQAYRPTQGKDTLGAYQSYVATRSAIPAWVTLTTRFTRGAGSVYAKSRCELWVDGTKATEYIGDLAGCPQDHVYICGSGSILQGAFDIGGPANAEWGGGGTVERGLERVWVPA